MLVSAMLSSLSLARDSVVVAGTILAAAAISGGVYYALLQRRPTAAQLERRRRENLAHNGRIVDGTLLDVVPSEHDPHALRYGYVIAGVSYECVQNVSGLSTHFASLQLDFPVLVRYDRTNPADSIVLAEEWSGLRKGMQRETEAARMCVGEDDSTAAASET